VVRYPSLEDEVRGGGHRCDALRTVLEREDTKNDAGLYLLLRAADRFHATNNRFPGSFERWIFYDALLSAGESTGTMKVRQALYLHTVQ
jgi:hypothetical protein